MIRLAWVQSRIQTTVAAAGLVILTVALALTGPHLVHLYNSTVANCVSRGDCQTATDTFLRHDNSLRTWLGVIVVAIPGIIGVFWGAPLVAREIEAGTYRLAWTQSVTRTRWMAVKLAFLGLASMATAGLLSLLVTWWASPLDRAYMNRFAMFDQRDLVPLGYAAFAFALGVTVGVLIRRTLPSMATALVAFVGVRVAMTDWVRSHLAPAAHTNLSLTASDALGFTRGPDGVTFVTGRASIPHAWVLSNRLVDVTGRTPSAASLHGFLQSACPNILNSPGPGPGSGAKVIRGPADVTIFQNCVNQLSTRFHLAVTYQPASHYWPLQWYETAIFLAGGLALAGFSLWWVRSRRA